MFAWIFSTFWPKWRFLGWGQNRGRDGAMLIPNELVLAVGVTSVPLLVKIGQEMRVWTDRQTHTQIDTN